MQRKSKDHTKTDKENRNGGLERKMMKQQYLNKVENFIQNRFGYCCYEVKKSKAVIYNLYVYPEFRLQGHAKRLLKYVINEIKETHDGEVFIEASPKEDGINLDRLTVFYEKIGLIVLNKIGEK